MPLYFKELSMVSAFRREQFPTVKNGSKTETVFDLPESKSLEITAKVLLEGLLNQARILSNNMNVPFTCTVTSKSLVA